MKIDLHTHFIPRDCFDMVDAEGRPFGPTIQKGDDGRDIIVADGVSLGPLVERVCDPRARLNDMDRIGLDMQALSINPSSLFNDLEVGAALRLYRRYNDAIAEVVTAYPDRFIGMATIPMQDVAAAVAELERAVTVLGLRGVQLGSNVNGMNLDERAFWPVYRTAQELGVPILLHPYYVAAAERLQRYWLINLVGNPADTAIAAASLIFGGVLAEFPRLRVVLAHGGGSAPSMLGRWEHGYHALDMCRSVPAPPSTYFGQLYFDTLTHSDAARAFLVGLVGAQHVVLGSDYPFQMGDTDPVATLRDTVGLLDGDREMILERSAAALFHLDA